jgi:Holliday junction DNA helicase RuvA
VIALLRGTVHERRADSVVLLTAGGVGYVLNCSGTTLAALPSPGGEAELLCHLAVREDAMTLFGFGSEPERDLFHLLLSVQAVGPKLALAVLSSGGPDEVATAIAGGDAKRLQAVPGVGTTGTGTAARGVVTATPTDEARDGLLGLGLAPEEVDTLLAVAHGETAAELIADALRRSRR